MAGSSDNALVSISAFAGLCEDLPLRLTSECIDCTNVIGTSKGLEVWRGDAVYPGAPKSLPVKGLGFFVWPDGHNTLLIAHRDANAEAAKGQLSALQAGLSHGILGAEVAMSNDPRKYVWFSHVRLGTLVLGGEVGESDMFSWDGHIDHPSVPYVPPVPVTYAFDWADRVVGIGDKSNPFLAYYSDLGETDIKASNFISFGDCPKASKLVAGAAGPDNTAYFWGDRGFWAVQYTGSYPFWFRPALVSPDCSCVSQRSIINVGGYFGWLGHDGFYLFDGQSVRRIDVSQDGRKAQRLVDTLAHFVGTEKTKAVGFWDAKRQAAIWSYPLTNKPSSEWRSLVWTPGTDSWWKLNRGWCAICEGFLDEQVVQVGGNSTGTWRMDYIYNIDADGTKIPWFVVVGGPGDGSRYNFREVKHTRPIWGDPQVTFDFWGDFEPTPTRYISDVKYAYDVGGSTHPWLDPGGAAGKDGFPPDALVECEAHIDLTAKKLIVKMSNEEPGGHRDGPSIPATEMVITGIRVG
jgi:hypothetical protein